MLFSVLISITKISRTPILVIDTLSWPIITEVDFSIGWTGSHLEFDHSHHPKAESKVSPK